MYGKISITCCVIHLKKTAFCTFCTIIGVCPPVIRLFLLSRNSSRKLVPGGEFYHIINSILMTEYTAQQAITGGSTYDTAVPYCPKRLPVQINASYKDTLLRTSIVLMPYGFIHACHAFCNTRMYVCVCVLLQEAHTSRVTETHPGPYNEPCKSLYLVYMRTKKPYLVLYTYVRCFVLNLPRTNKQDLR